MDRPITIAVLAIGGQGGGVLVDWIVALAEREGWQAQSTSVPGVAQRTGATIYYVEAIRAAPGWTPVFSAMAAPGDVDIVIAAEWMEAGRAIQRGLVTPDRTTLIASTHRTYAVSEKETPCDGTADSSAVTAAAKAASRRLVAYDMAALAEQAGSAMSSVLFGALCASGTLPLPRAAFEATITEAGIGVQSSLRGFALGCDGVAAPLIATQPPPPPVLRPVGHPPYDALLTRAAALPETAHTMVAEGLRHVIAYQDIAYGAAYLDAVEAVWRAAAGAGQSTPPPVGVPIASPPSEAAMALPPSHTTEPSPASAATGALVEAAAKYIARAMVYDDIIRVASLKTQPARTNRIQREMGGDIIATTEFMHPRMQELLGLLPPRLGTALERRPRLVATLDRVFCGPRRIRTDTVFGFLLLYAVAGLRPWRRRTLRHIREFSRYDSWLRDVKAAAAEDPAVAVELLANQRLIKGYSDTHARGLDKFARVSAAAARIRSRPDSAAWIRRLREAALKDEAGIALDEALRTVDSFLDERTAA